MARTKIEWIVGKPEMLQCILDGCHAPAETLVQFDVGDITLTLPLCAGCDKLSDNELVELIK